MVQNNFFSLLSFSSIFYQCLRPHIITSYLYLSTIFIVAAHPFITDEDATAIICCYPCLLLFYHQIGVVSSLNWLLSLPIIVSSPTGKGSRSAANEILSKHLEKSLNIPNLSLPEPIDPLLNDHVKNINIPEEIEYPMLELGDYQTIDRLLHYAREFGAFMIIDHGIFHEDSLQSLFIEDSYRVFCDLE